MSRMTLVVDVALEMLDHPSLEKEEPPEWWKMWTSRWELE